MKSEYTIFQKIQQTIYGDVYEGYDNVSERPVALKLSRIYETFKRGENPLGEVAILKELSSSDDLNGKYIIHLYDSFETMVDDLPFYCTALEYADGGDLLDKILKMAKQKQRLPFSQMRKYFVMLAEGLKVIHQHGISHLDLSLENVLLKNDELRICDFGQALRKRTIHDVDLRRGKLKYMPPEVYRLKEYDGYKADVWSLGVILWQMITSTIIFKKPSVNDPRFALLARGTEGIQLLLQQDGVNDVPSDLIDLLSNMLNVNAQDRYLIDDVLKHSWVPELKPKVQVSEEEKCPLPRLSTLTVGDAPSFCSFDRMSSRSSNMSISVSEENLQAEMEK